MTQAKSIPVNVTLDPAAVFAGQRIRFANLFLDVSAYLRPAKGERFEIEVFDVSPEEALRLRLEAVLKEAGLYERCDEFPGRRVILRDTASGETVMMNAPFEYRTCAEALARGTGRVLIGGLGLGILPMTLQRKPEVREIVILEKYREVIDLVASQLPLGPKVKILEADVFTWDPAPGERFDTIWLDIWNTSLPREHLEMAALRRRYTPLLAPDGWLGVWQEADAVIWFEFYGRLLAHPGVPEAEKEKLRAAAAGRGRPS